MATRPTRPVDRRIVIHVMTGVRAGLYTITGCESQLLEGKRTLPGRIPDVPLFDHRADVVHAGTHTRYHLYREWLNYEGAAGGSFNEAQQ